MDYYKKLSFLIFEKSFGKLKKIHLFRSIKKLIAREKIKIHNMRKKK